MEEKEAKPARGRGRWGGKSGLVIELLPESAALLRALAIHGDGRADHVTLAFGVDPETFEARWVPGERGVGSAIAMRAIGVVADERVQAVIIEIDGSTVRP